MTFLSLSLRARRFASTSRALAFIFWAALPSFGTAAESAAESSAADGARAVVESFHHTLRTVMQANLSCEARQTRYAAALADDFDVALIAQQISKKHWNQFSAAQQAQLIDVLNQQFTLTYAQQFARDQGAQFITGETRALRGNTQLVQTELRPAQGQAVRLDYVLRQKARQWRIVNIVAEGVSDLALRSAQYDALITQQGFDGLLAFLREQVRALQAQCA